VKTSVKTPVKMPVETPVKAGNARRLEPDEVLP